MELLFVPEMGISVEREGLTGRNGSWRYRAQRYASHRALRRFLARSCRRQGDWELARADQLARTGDIVQVQVGDSEEAMTAVAIPTVLRVDRLVGRLQVSAISKSV